MLWIGFRELGAAMWGPGILKVSQMDSLENRIALYTHYG